LRGADLAVYPFPVIIGMKILKSEDTTSALQSVFQLVPYTEIVLLTKMASEPRDVPAVVIRSLFAGPESALKRTIVLPSMGVQNRMDRTHRFRVAPPEYASTICPFE